MLSFVHADCKQIPGNPQRSISTKFTVGNCYKSKVLCKLCQCKSFVVVVDLCSLKVAIYEINHTSCAVGRCCLYPLSADAGICMFFQTLQFWRDSDL